jgi:hypothetical protein
VAGLPAEERQLHALAKRLVEDAGNVTDLEGEKDEAVGYQHAVELVEHPR